MGIKVKTMTADITRIHSISISPFHPGIKKSYTFLSPLEIMGLFHKSWPINLSRNDVYQFYVPKYFIAGESLRVFLPFPRQSRRSCIPDGVVTGRGSPYQPGSLSYHMEGSGTWEPPGAAELWELSYWVFGVLYYHSMPNITSPCLI